ncbi:MAG: transcriptional repressor [Candidatus Calescibacterium sp.]|nr:transcriptional repressor [Candidatus Calescibacterium sp.]MCX7733479.1 transcriptional repressor [bacterium]MDW8087401.1 Fur family transcriptional regulator [Candidatus Calescibacterium sp.]
MNRQEILNKFKEKGLRVTPQRLTLFMKLAEMKGHIKAEDLYNALKEEIPSISISTVYRTLKEFESKGFIYSLPSSTDYGLTVFDTNLEPHHHFICLRCEKIYDVPEEYVEIKVKNIQGSIQYETVIMKGLCESCKNKKKKVS